MDGWLVQNKDWMCKCTWIWTWPLNTSQFEAHSCPVTEHKWAISEGTQNHIPNMICICALEIRLLACWKQRMDVHLYLAWMWTWRRNTSQFEAYACPVTEHTWAISEGTQNTFQSCFAFVSMKVDCCLLQKNAQRQDVNFTSKNLPICSVCLLRNGAYLGDLWGTTIKHCNHDLHFCPWNLIVAFLKTNAQERNEICPVTEQTWMSC